MAAFKALRKMAGCKAGADDTAPRQPTRKQIRNNKKHSKRYLQSVSSSSLNNAAEPSSGRAPGPTPNPKRRRISSFFSRLSTTNTKAVHSSSVDASCAFRTATDSEARDSSSTQRAYSCLVERQDPSNYNVFTVQRWRAGVRPPHYDTHTALPVPTTPGPTFTQVSAQAEIDDPFDDIHAAINDDTETTPTTQYVSRTANEDAVLVVEHWTNMTRVIHPQQNWKIEEREMDQEDLDEEEEEKGEQQEGGRGLTAMFRRNWSGLVGTLWRSRDEEERGVVVYTPEDGVLGRERLIAGV